MFLGRMSQIVAYNTFVIFTSDELARWFGQTEKAIIRHSQILKLCLEVESRMTALQWPSNHKSNLLSSCILMVTMVASIVGLAHGPCYPRSDKPNRICILSPIHTEARLLNFMCTRLNDTQSRNRFICGRPMHQGLGPSSASTTTCRFSKLRQGKSLLHTTSDRYAVHNYNHLQLSFATPRGRNKINVGKVRFCLLA